MNDLFEICSEARIWRVITSHPRYQVSNHGEIRREKSSRPIALYLDQDGYHRVRLWSAGRKKCLLVHRLVMLAFVGLAPSRAHIVCHNDGAKVNNHVLNLRWGTHADNAKDVALHFCGRARRSASRVSNEQVVAIKILLAGGMPQHAIARVTRVGRSTVGNIALGYYWNHVLPGDARQRALPTSH